MVPSVRVIGLSLLVPALIAGGEILILGNPVLLWPVLAVLLTISLVGIVEPRHQEPRVRCVNFEPLLLLVGTLAIVWLIPAIVILWIIRPSQINRLAKVATLLASISGSVLYYWRNKKLFPSAADKATYFSATFLVPVGIVSVLLD